MLRRTCGYAFGILVVLLICNATSAQTPLRIATFNAEILTAPGRRDGRLQKYRWDLARRAQFERVAAVIEAINPDVLNLVEATSKASVDLLVEILHEKGLTGYHGYHVENHDGFTSMDVALISKIEPKLIGGKRIRTMYSERDDPTWRQVYQVKTKRGGTSNRNGSIARNAVFLLEVGGYQLGFLGLHLKSNPSNDDANALRESQAKIAQRIIHQEIVGRGYLPIVLGDLNDYDPDVPDRDETRSTRTAVLRELKDFDKQHAGNELANVARLIPRQADRYTSFWDRNENRARDPHDVFTMLDHVLLPVELMPLVKRAFVFHCVDLETSDHHAVVVDLVLPVKLVSPVKKSENE